MTPRIGDEYMANTLQLVAYPSVRPDAVFQRVGVGGESIEGQGGIVQSIVILGACCPTVAVYDW